MLIERGRPGGGILIQPDDLVVMMLLCVEVAEQAAQTDLVLRAADSGLLLRCRGLRRFVDFSVHVDALAPLPIALEDLVDPPVLV